MNSVPGDAGGDPAWLTIREVSRRTGIPVAGLRNWEQRYGLPRPQRSPAGQRRYTDADCDLLAAVLGHRASGLSLPAAMARATASSRPGQSIFAGVRRHHPDLQVHVLSKPLLLAVTRAIEDECCARAPPPRSRFPVDSPMNREWTLICDALDHPACVTAWEYPGQAQDRDQDRTFEVLWSADPQVVRTAARIGTGLAATAFPEIASRLAARLAHEPAPASADLRRASGLLGRTLDYLARAPRPAATRGD